MQQAGEKMKSVTVLCPAKLNLTLDITGVEENGYHTMDMVMQAVSLFEKVTLTKAKDIVITSDAGRLPLGKTNTAYQAAVAFFTEVGLLAGVKIHIEKKTPIRAGMAGGSADAAAVLYGLNLLYGARLTRQELVAIGAQVGADVPFELLGATARVSGFGEKLQPLPPVPDCRFVVVMPGYGISTPQAFARYDKVGAAARPNNDAAVEALRKGDYYALCRSLGNALEKASAGADTAKICRVLKAAGADAALMTGSGAAVFGVFAHDGPALAALDQLAGVYPKVFLLHPVNHGPLAQR